MEEGRKEEEGRGRKKREEGREKRKKERKGRE